MSAEIENKMPEVKADLNFKLELMTRLMLEDVHRRSVRITPLREGALRAMVAKQMMGKTGIIEWRAPYASYQERGMRADGTRVVRHYTTPGTHAHYAEESVQAVMNNLPEYITKAGIV